MSAMVRELGAATPPSLPLRRRLDALLQFHHSPATAALLGTIYGGTPAWTLKRLPGSTGPINYRAMLAPLQFVDADGGNVTWAALPVDLTVSRDGSTLTFNGKWPSFSSSDKALRASMRDLTLTGRQRRASDGLLFGSATVDVASVTMEMAGPGSGARLAFDGIHSENSVREQGGGIEMGYQLAVRRIAFGSNGSNKGNSGNSGNNRENSGAGKGAIDGIDNIVLRSRVTSLDRQSLLELQAAGSPAVVPGATLQQRQEALAPLLRTMARGAIRSNSAIELDELSASFHGHSVRASGRISLEGAQPADADNWPALLKHLVAQLSIRAPRALLTEVATAMATVQLRASAQDVAVPGAVARLAASLDDTMLTKLVASGMVRVDGDQLVTDITYRASAGGLRVNDKAMPLPAMPGSAAVAAPARAGGAPVAAGGGDGRGSATLLRARRVDGSCTLPDYPAEIIAADAQLTLTLRLVAKADGSVAHLTLALPSTRPDYDQAVLAAAARCVYAPALRNGLPVDAPVAWKIVREPGSRRP